MKSSISNPLSRCGAVWLLIHVFLIAHISTVESSSSSSGTGENNNDTTAQRFAVQPNLLLVVLGGIPANMLYTADRHAMSSSSTPSYAANIRLLERNSMTFLNAYTNIARSAPSRTSMLTSLHPRRQLQTMGDEAPGSSTIFQRNLQTVFPTWLRSNLGIETVGAGRVFKSPQATVALGGFQQYAIPRMGDQDQLCGTEPFICVVEDETTLTDNDVADRAISYLRQFARSQQNFAMVVGFHRAYADKSFPTWTQLQIDKRRSAISAQQTEAAYIQQASSLFAVNSPRRLSLSEVTERKVSAFAAIQWVDFCLGKIIDELRGLRFWDNTVIIVTSDIAQSIGEYSDVSPDGSAVYEHSTRVPLYIRDPRSPKSFGKRSGARVELVDLATTVYDVLGADRPANGPGTSNSKLQGNSLRGLLSLYQNDPRATVPGNAYFNISLRHAAISESARCTRSALPYYNFPAGTPLPSEAQWTDCADYPNRVDAVAISMRTPKYRYTEYRTTVGGQVVWESEGLVGRELFSHEDDAGLEKTVDGNTYELSNLAPCNDAVACRLLVPPASKPTSENPSVGLPSDPKGKNFYTAPALPVNANHATLVRAYSLMLRAAARDGTPLCSNHGTVNPDTGACAECDEGWASSNCGIPTFPELDPSEEDGTASPTISPPPTTRPPVGAPTLPPVAPPTTKSPTNPTTKLTLSPVTKAPTTRSPTIPPLTCPGRLSQAHCVQDAENCLWRNNMCVEVTPSPTKALNMKDSCQSLLSQTTCTKINGCIWQGKDNGCQVPFPTPCGCESRLDAISAFVLPDRGSGGKQGEWQLFRNACHAQCKGAILPTPDPTPGPTPATRSPTTPVPTYERGRPLPKVPGEGNAQPVDSLTLYLVMDASSNIGGMDDSCVKQRGFACLHVASMFFVRVMELLQEYVRQGVSQFRIGVWAFSCQSNEPIWVDIKLPSPIEEGVRDALRTIRNNISPRGGRCPSKVFQVILEHDNNERQFTSRRAMVMLQAGPINPPNLEEAIEGAKQLRQAGVGTFSIVVAVAVPQQNVPQSRGDGLKIAGNVERVFYTNPKQGVLALLSVVNPLTAAILATVNEPDRVTSSASDDLSAVPEDFYTGDGYSEEEAGGDAAGVVVGVLSVIVIVAAASFVVYRRRRAALKSRAAQDIDDDNHVLAVFNGKALARSKSSSSSSSTTTSAAAGSGNGMIVVSEMAGDECEILARGSPVKTVRRRSLDFTNTGHSVNKVLSFSLGQSTTSNSSSFNHNSSSAAGGNGQVVIGNATMV